MHSFAKAITRSQLSDHGSSWPEMALIDTKK